MRQTFFSVLISILAISAVVNAETVQLSFSGVTTEGRYCLLDSVKIENLTQNWTQTLDCSIDTTYELPVVQAPMGIDNVAASNDGNGLLSVIQKFAINNTIVSINPIDNGVVRMRVFDMVGRVVIEHAEYLSAGQHQYILQLGAPQTYMISVVSDTEYASAKILNMASSGTYDLSRVASLPSMNQAQSRRKARAEGADLMQYTGYTNQKGVAVASEPITQYQSSPEQIVFHFSPVAKSEEGMYTAMIGFNSQLYQYSFDRLTTSNLTQHQNFVSNLNMASGTILYHAVYTALDKVVKAPVPQKVENVSLVTFTDGLDIGSWRMNSNYPSEALYLEAVNKQIHRTCIDGVKLDAYAIGVKGSDVTDITRFENDLYQLASDPDNVYSVTNMDEVNAKFREIAAKIYNTKVTYSLTIKLPAPDPGSIIRFTFDDVTDATKSIYYIEGTYNYDFNNGVGLLENITYSGIRCSNGSTWISTPSGIFDIFTINNLTNSLGEKVSTSTMKQWTYIPSTQSWQVNSEFSPSSNSSSAEEHSSAIVMLVLDCSSSLSSDFSKMQTAAKTFLGILAGQGDITTPTVSKATFTLGDLQVTMKASVSGTGNLSIVDKGFCVSENQNMDNAKFYSAGEGTANFTYTLNNLIAGRTYYCRPYADNQLGRSFGTTSSFTAIEYTPPTVTTLNVTNINVSSATCGGNVTFDGYTSVTERGICWSTNPNPTINDSILVLGSGTGSFSGTLQNLTDGTTYYIRAYAVNNRGVGYGEEKSFTTVVIVPPTIITSEVADITINRALCGGNVTFDGNSSVIERGICWSTKPNPTIEDSVIRVGSGIGSFTKAITDLEEESTYYVRAYAKNNKCIGYGEEKSFATLAIVTPLVTLSSINITSINSVSCSGEVTFDGNASIIERGFCWSTNPNPTIEDNVIIGDEDFLGAITDLEAWTNYYVRAYARNSKEIGYSEELSASNIYISVISYSATQKLVETTDNTRSGLHTSAFENIINIHEFREGKGTLVFNGQISKCGDYAFYKCVGLTSVTIPNSVTSIGESVFSGCTSLKSIVIPNSVKYLGTSAFSGCKGMTSVTIGNSVTNIGAYAFYGCTNLKSIVIPNSVKYLGASAFSGCKGLTSVTIGNSVKDIQSKTFYECTGLKSIVIPNSATTIGGSAFSGCTGLTSVSIGNSVTTIYTSAFYGCTGLTSIVIPSSVIRIGSSAFYDCRGLTSITIGEGVTAIEKEAFSECRNLISLTSIATTPPSCGSSPFSSVDEFIPVYVPASSVSAYKNALVWKNFRNIKAIIE